MQLKGRVALITGASSGIGRATALLMAQEGARVAVLGTNAAELDEVVREIGERSAIPIVADVSRPDEMKRAIRTVIDAWDSLEIVFANAGVNGVWAPLEELEPEEWDRTLGINLTGTFLTVKYALPYLKRHGGSVVVTSSVNGTRMFSNSGATAYACSKAAQVAFTKMTAVELAPHKVRINVVCPGAIKTPIHKKTDRRDLDDIQIPVEFPEGEIPLTGDEQGDAMQVARLVLFLVSDAADHITGTEVWIDGAQSLLKG